MYLTSKKNKKQLQIAFSPNTQVIKMHKNPKSPKSFINGLIKNKGENAKPDKMNINVLKMLKTFGFIFPNSYGKFLNKENSLPLSEELSNKRVKRIKETTPIPAREKIQIALGEIIEVI